MVTQPKRPLKTYTASVEINYMIYQKVLVISHQLY